MLRRIGALTLACVLSSGVTAAQTSAPAKPAQKADAASSSKADALMQQGIQLRREARDAEALERFERAYRLSPSARALAQMGLAELALSRFDFAEAHLREALESEDDWVRRNRSTLERSLNAAGAHLGSVSVSTNVSDAELWLNGIRAGALPHGAHRVLAGSVRVELRRRSGERAERALTLAAGGTHHVQIDFVQVRSAAKAPRAARSAAEPPGERVRPLPRPRSNAPRTVAWMLLATGAVFLGEAVVAHVLRENYASRYDDDGECLYGDLSRKQRCGELLGKARTMQVLATAGYIGAGVAFGTAGLLFALPSGEAPSGRSTGAQLFYSRRF